MIAVPENSKESEIAHPNLPSTMRPEPTGSDLQIFSSLLNLDYMEIHSEKEKAADKDEKFLPTCSSNESHLFFQNELDSVRDLGLPKDAAKLLSCNGNENLYPRITLFWYPNRENDYVLYFNKDRSLVYCTDVNSLVQMFQIDFIAE